MKKLILITLAAITFTACTTSSQDIQMLQENFSTVYKINSSRYIVCDSVNTWDARISMDGKIYSLVKIK